MGLCEMIQPGGWGRMWRFAGDGGNYVCKITELCDSRQMPCSWPIWTKAEGFHATQWLCRVFIISDILYFQKCLHTCCWCVSNRCRSLHKKREEMYAHAGHLKNFNVMFQCADLKGGLCCFSTFAVFCPPEPCPVGSIVEQDSVFLGVRERYYI